MLICGNNNQLNLKLHRQQIDILLDEIKLFPLNLLVLLHDKALKERSLSFNYTKF